MHPLSRKWRRRLGAAFIALGLIAFLALAFFALPAAAATDYDKHADGLAVYLGVLPVQLLKGPSESHLATMHGVVPSSSATHHVVVAVYDERTGKQFDRATVEATVVPFGPWRDTPHAGADENRHDDDLRQLLSDECARAVRDPRPNPPAGSSDAGAVQL